MIEAVTFSDITHLAVVVMAIWGFVKIVNEIIATIQKKAIKDHNKEESIEKLKADREEDVCQYNKQFSDIRNSQDDIRTEFEAKVQEIRAEMTIIKEEQYMATQCLRAVLDGLHQLNCNGKVTIMSEKLDEFMDKKAHNYQ